MAEQIKVQTDKMKTADGKPVATEFPYDFGTDMASSVKLFGEAIVWKLFKAKATIEVQDVARNALVAGKTPDEAAKLAIAHKLGESTRVSKDPIAQGIAAMSAMTPEQRKAFLAELMKKAAALGG